MYVSETNTVVDGVKSTKPTFWLILSLELGKTFVEKWLVLISIDTNLLRTNNV